MTLSLATGEGVLVYRAGRAVGDGVRSDELSGQPGVEHCTSVGCAPHPSPCLSPHIFSTVHSVFYLCRWYFTAGDSMLFLVVLGGAAILEAHRAYNHNTSTDIKTLKAKEAAIVKQLKVHILPLDCFG